KVGEMLKEIQFAAFYASPLKRTHETMHYIIKENQQEMKMSDLKIISNLREMDFGSWEGKYVAEIKTEPEYQHLRHQPEKFDPSAFGGESYPALIARMKQAFCEICQNHSEEENILVVSHGVALTAFLKTLE